jgi:hypothetical protein
VRKPKGLLDVDFLEFMVHGDYYRTQTPREVGPGLHFSVGNGDISRAKERLVGMFPDCTIEGCDEIHAG